MTNPWLFIFVILPSFIPTAHRPEEYIMMSAGDNSDERY